MKTFKKVLTALLAVVLVLSIVGCAPISLTKQWCYEYNDDILSEKLDIGVYIFAMYQAYSQAQSYASESEGYVDGENFLDLAITDDDGNTVIAREWIKTETKNIATNLIALDYLVAKNGATVDPTTLANAEEEAKTYWNDGYSYSYYSMPAYKDMLEDYGVSLESFSYSTSVASVKQTALFTKLYDKGGIEEVSDEELTTYFTDEYVAYSYIPVNMYTSETDDEGYSTSTAYTKSEIKSTVATLEGYATEISNGTLTFDDAVTKATKDLTFTSGSEVADKVELFEDTESSNEDIAKAVKKLGNGKAKVITVGEDGDSPIAYLVVKHNVKNYVKDYIENNDNRTSVLSNYKTEDLQALIDQTTTTISESSALTENTSVLNKYDPDMFYEEPEESTEETTA